jgi:hypothetical protein
MSFLINPFAFAVAGGDFESIATVTVGSGGATSALFDNIPSTYQHLQIRAIAKRSDNANGTYLGVRLNGDTGANYARHQLAGTGSAATARAATGSTVAIATATEVVLPGNGTANLFGAQIVDILDYADTSKNTTLRAFGGFDANGSGNVLLMSSLWIDTSAVTSVTLMSGGDTWAQHSTFALFGVKAP